jgi:hypothetical protein
VPDHESVLAVALCGGPVGADVAAWIEEAGTAGGESDSGGPVWSVDGDAPVWSVGANATIWSVGAGGWAADPV